jgi:hypothetical protein
MKTCVKCGETKEYSQFNKSASRNDGYHPYCKACCKQYRDENRERILAKKKEQYRENIELSREKLRTRYRLNSEKIKKYNQDFYSIPENRKKKILFKARERAHKEGISFDITLEDIVLPDKCPYLGIPLTHDLGKGQLPSNSSIDRIDSSKGYIKGNVQIISRLANTMKSNATYEQLLAFAKAIIFMDEKRLKEIA